MKCMNWISIYLHGVVFLTTSVTAGQSRAPSDMSIIRSARSINSKCGTDFLFEYLGATDKINHAQLSILMKQLSIGNDVTHKSSDCSKCLSPNDVFRLNGFQISSRLNRSDFERTFPILLQQLVSKSCKVKSDDSQDSGRKVGSAKVWGFGILSVTIISLASMLGAFVVPCMNRDFYKKVLLFMVSLAVGVLGGSGLFHLLPHTLGLGSDGDHDYLWKCSTVVGGIYFFFVTENLMKMYIRFSEWKRHKLSKREIDGSLNIIEAADLRQTVSSGDKIPDNKNSSHAPDDARLKKESCQNECEKEREPFITTNSSGKADSFFERVAPVAWMIIIGDGLHNFIDGLAIGVSFTNNIVEGISTSLAIFCEELPHELGDFAILLNSGLSYKQALLANFFSACTCYVGMTIGILLGRTTQIVKWIYAIAAGMFLYISLVDMLPEATGLQVTISSTSKRETIKNFITVNVAMILGFFLMLILAVYSGNIQV